MAAGVDAPFEEKYITVIRAVGVQLLQKNMLGKLLKSS